MEKEDRRLVMRTVFTTEDVKNLIENIFNGNLAQHRLSKGEVEYVNENSEKVVVIDEESGEKIKEIDLAEYLNISFYNWKQRLVNTDDNIEDTDQRISVFEAWLKSLNFSLNKSYALVEVIDEDVVASQEIDSSTIFGRITFLIQADKIKNLEYYNTKIRNKFLGVPQDIQNSFGEIIKSYILLGSLVYDQEPLMTAIGECVIVTSNFKVSYLGDAQTFNDTKVEISLTGDDLYYEDGSIVGTTKYMEMPITKYTWQNIWTLQPQPMANRPDLTGHIATAISCVKTLTFYDFNKELINAFNEMFWNCSCVKKNGRISQIKEINEPIYIRITNKGNTYVYRDVIDTMEKSMTNSDFNICSITLRGLAQNTDIQDASNVMIIFDSGVGVGNIPIQRIYKGQVLEIPLDALQYPNGEGYLSGFYLVKKDENLNEISRIEFTVGRMLTYDKLVELYEEYSNDLGYLIFYPLWDFDVPLEDCVVTLNGVQITGSNKPIINNGNGTYTVPKYTRLDVRLDEGCSLQGEANAETFTQGNDYNGSPEGESYVIITGNPVSFNPVCYVPW